MIMGRYVSTKLRFRQAMSSRWSSSSSMTSSEVRKSFLDFFSDSPAGFHKIVPSSSLIPYTDPSSSFVTSGMSQFKSILLGQSEPKSLRMANCQKCVSLGCKHGDISKVGIDGSCHTFFEMLGNWSFGDYYKKEAISMAWELLTGPLGLPMEKLYVTYFAGDQNLKLPPDLETLEHWRSLGLSEDRILPFGLKDNFWEMGCTGPCGPCTEIHYDHLSRGPEFINKGVPDVVEVWNLTFMEYDRIDDQTLQHLEKKHVGTGLRLECLAAIKCGSMSIYDSDLFQPLLDLICKESQVIPYSGQFREGEHLDAKYRILVDHSRMVAASIADGIFPMINSNLRSVLRHALTICKEDFKCDHKLLRDLTHCTVEILGDQYPEMRKNVSRIDATLEYESEIFEQHLYEGSHFKSNLVSTNPNAHIVSANDAKRIFEAVNYIKRNTSEQVLEMSGELGLKIFTNFGFTIEQLKVLAEVLNVTFSETEFQEALLNRKRNSMLEIALEVKNINKYPKTDVTFVQTYKSSEPLHYTFPAVAAKILQIQDENGSVVYKLPQGAKGKIFLDKTSFFAESGGQVGDKGKLVTKYGSIFEVTNCQKVLNDPERICHIGTLREGTLQKNDAIQTQIDITHRLQCMQNHTGAHLLNAALHSLLPITVQNSFYADSDYFNFEFASFQTKIDSVFITKLEKKIYDMIADDLPITRELKSSEEVFNFENMDKLIAVPGNMYPTSVPLICLPNGVQEPCCGTHLHRTGDVQTLVVLNCESVSTGVQGLTCVTGAKAVKARIEGIETINNVAKINDEVQNIIETSTTTAEIHDLITKIQKKKISLQKMKHYPFTVKIEMIEILDNLLSQLSAMEINYDKTEMVQPSLKEIISKKCNLPFLTQFYEMHGNTKIALSKATKLYQTKPILLIVKHKEKTYGRACVPETYLTDTFNAETWLDVVGKEINSKARPPRGGDKRLVCIMLKRKNNLETDIILQAMAKANEFAKHSIRNT